MFLHRQLIDLELLANSTNRKVEKMGKMGTELVGEVCKKSFFIGFERCKSMAQAFLSNNHAELLKINHSDRSLKAVVDDYIGTFTKSFELALSVA